MQLPGSAAIPAPYRERGQMAYRTGLRIVDMVREDLRPSQILTRDAFQQCDRGELRARRIEQRAGPSCRDWRGTRASICRSPTGSASASMCPCSSISSPPANISARISTTRAVSRPWIAAADGRLAFIREDAFDHKWPQHRRQLPRAPKLSCREVIRRSGQPLKARAGFLVLTGNLFDSAITKTSVISEEYRERYFANPADPDAFEGRAFVFDGPEDYHARIDDPALDIHGRRYLVMRGAGPIGFPGAAEVVNMQPPARLIRAGVRSMPCIGDGRQSGTSGSPSILNASPEAAAGGNHGAAAHRRPAADRSRQGARRPPASGRRASP